MSRSLIQVLAIVIAVVVLLAISVPGWFSTGDSDDSATNDQAASERAAGDGAASAAVMIEGPRADVEPSSKPVGTSVGNRAPEFELLDPDGNTHRLADYHGQVVILDFWGTWCAPCIRIMPQLQALHEKYEGRGVQVVGISCRERGGADPAAFMAQRNFTYGLLLNGEQKAVQDYAVRGYPTLVVVGVDGEIIYRDMGATGNKEDILSPVIDEHLAAHGL